MKPKKGDTVKNKKTGEVFLVKIVRGEIILLERKDGLRLESMYKNSMKQTFEKLRD